MDSISNITGGNVKPSNSDGPAASAAQGGYRGAPEDSAGISHPKTYEEGSDGIAGGNVRPTNSDGPAASAAMGEYRSTPSDHTGVSHPTTYEGGRENITGGNVRPTNSDGAAAASMQGNATRFEEGVAERREGQTEYQGQHSTIGRAENVVEGQQFRESAQPTTVGKVEHAVEGRGVKHEGRHEAHHEGHKESKKEKVEEKVEDEAEGDKHRKTHEETTAAIKATQEKAMAGTHEAPKQGESLRREVEMKDEQEPKNDGLVHEGEQDVGTNPQDENAANDTGVKEKHGMKETLLGKLHKA